MKRLLDATLSELRYLSYSKAILVALIVVIAATGLCIRAEYANVGEAHAEYQRTKTFHESQGADADAALREDLHIERHQEGVETTTIVDNPIRYSYEELVRALQGVAPSSLLSVVLTAVTFLFGQFLFSVLGVYIGSYDFASKTTKIKAPRFCWTTSVGAKILASLAITLLLLTVASLVAWVAGVILHGHARGLLSADGIVIPSTAGTVGASWLLQVGVSFFVGSLFACLGLFLAIAIRGRLIVYAIVVAYYLLVPNLGTYDLGNTILVIGHRYFPAAGDLLSVSRPLSVPVAFLLAAVILAASCGGALAAARRQSKFVP